MSLLAVPVRPADLLEVIEARSGQNLYACYQCGRCTAGCPFALAPQQVIRLLQLGQVARAIEHDTTWECASCLTCAASCPKGLNPARIQRVLRTLEPAGAATGAAGDGAGGDGVGAGRTRRRAPRGHAHPLRTRLFAHIHRLSRLGCALTPVSNWALRLPGSRLLADRLLGIHRGRALPPFASPTFPEWFRRHRPRGDGRRGTVLLFHDTFMDFNYPATGIAATELLEAAGFRVELADMVCCGRPMISKGLLAQAARQARINVDRLTRQAEGAAGIVGCEPSCLLALRDEYPDLLPEPGWGAQARALAERAFLIDEFLGRLADEGTLGLAFRKPPGDPPEVLFHGHCHQKALAAPARSVQLLRLAGYRAEMVEAACCGMAGAYGYEKEHYAASRAAGERALFPALRARPEARVAVMGTSCRQQIAHFTGREARHVAELLREALA